MKVTHSCYGQMVKATQSLPDDLAPIFDGHYRKGHSIAAICQEQGITVDEFLKRKTDLLRYLRGAAAYKGQGAQAGGAA